MDLIDNLFAFFVAADDAVIREIWNGAWFVLGATMVLSFALIALQRVFAKPRRGPIYNDLVFQICVGLGVFSTASATRAGYIWLLLHCENAYGIGKCNFITDYSEILFAAGMLAIGSGVCIIRILSPEPWRPWIWIGAGAASIGAPGIFYAATRWMTFGPPTTAVMEGRYSPFLVVASVIEAILASYVALELINHSQQTKSNLKSLLWTGSAAIVMGSGIWSMHFIGMLAFSLPGTDVNYDIPLTILSFAVPILVCLVGFLAVRTSPTALPIAVCGCFIGVGIVSMHYIGMGAMKVEGGTITYNPSLFLLSVFIAVTASIVAVWITSIGNTASIIERKILAAIFGGFAVSGMHYVGMSATSFCTIRDGESITAIDQASLGLWVILASACVLAAFASALFYDRRYM